LPKEWVSYCVFAFTPLLNEVVVHQRIKDICELPLISSPSIADTAVFKSLHPLANPQGLDYGYVERLVYLILQEVLKSLIIILLPSSMVALTASPLLIYSLAGLVP